MDTKLHGPKNAISGETTAIIQTSRSASGNQDGKQRWRGVTGRGIGDHGLKATSGSHPVL